MRTEPESETDESKNDLFSNEERDRVNSLNSKRGGDGESRSSGRRRRYMSK